LDISNTLRMRRGLLRREAQAIIDGKVMELEPGSYGAEARLEAIDAEILEVGLEIEKIGMDRMLPFFAMLQREGRAERAREQEEAGLFGGLGEGIDDDNDNDQERGAR